MGMPERIRVRLISEEVGSVSITPVVVREMTPAELAGQIVSRTGKDAERVRRILRAGSLASEGSRFLWEPLAADAGEVARLLDAFPDPDPQRRFDAGACVLAVLRYRAAPPVEITREAGAKRRFLRRGSFWTDLLAVVQSAAPRYEGYSYRLGADRFSAALDATSAAAIRRSAVHLAYSETERRLSASDPVAVDLYLPRSAER
jgi:hypothetical protein